MLEYAEKAMAPVFEFHAVKSAWLANIEGAEQENFAQISLIINNTKKGYTSEIKQIRKALNGLENDKNIRFRFCIYKVTEYWDRLKSMDVKLYSEMRLSIILYDPSGFFAPLKILLLEGKIPCTREAVQSIMKESPKKILKVHNEMKREIISSLYNLVIDAGQAPIVLAGYDPPIPRKLPELLDAVFVKTNLLGKDTVKICSDIITYYKDVEHGKITVISGNDIHVFLEASEIFVERMEKLMGKLPQPA